MRLSRKRLANISQRSRARTQRYSQSVQSTGGKQRKEECPELSALAQLTVHWRERTALGVWGGRLSSNKAQTNHFPSLTSVKGWCVERSRGKEKARLWPRWRTEALPGETQKKSQGKLKRVARASRGTQCELSKVSARKRTRQHSVLYRPGKNDSERSRQLLTGEARGDRSL